MPSSGPRGDWLAHTSRTQIPTDLNAFARKRKVNKADRTDPSESVARLPINNFRLALAVTHEVFARSYFGPHLFASVRGPGSCRVQVAWLSLEFREW